MARPARPRIESFVLTEDLVRNVFHFVGDGAAFLRFEHVCKAWRRVAIDDAIWAKRPLLYGARTFSDANANGGRRFVLTSRAGHAAFKTMRTSVQDDHKYTGACVHVLGEQPLCRIVRTFADRVLRLEQNKSELSYPIHSATGNYIVHLDPVSFELSDGCVATMIDIVEDSVAVALRRALKYAIHRSRDPTRHDYHHQGSYSDSDVTLGTMDLYTERHSVETPSPDHDAYRHIDMQTRIFYQIINPHIGDDVASFVFPQYEHRHFRRIHETFLPEISDADATRIVRRMARYAGVIAMTGATFGAIWTLFMGTLSALVVEVCKLDNGSGDDDEDDESYSSGDETRSDASHIYRYTFPPEPNYHEVVPANQRPPRVKPTVAEIIRVANHMRLVEGYYSGRTDEDMSNAPFSDLFGLAEAASSEGSSSGDDHDPSAHDSASNAAGESSDGDH
mmetsp:Transcript_10115/g.31190  ORF Transcript_10115/g.31190 Transcript_10115/m.31190 type:complete len:449 (-) Transcript_10115:33-1379(-)